MPDDITSTTPTPDLSVFEEQLYSLYAESQQEYDKQLLYIATGTLGITFAFIEKIIPLKEAKVVWVLFVGWLLLVGCIILFLFSHRESKCQAEKFIDRFQEYKRKEITLQELRQHRKDCNASIDRFNRWTGRLLVAGIVVILIFIFININY